MTWEKKIMHYTRKQFRILIKCVARIEHNDLSFPFPYAAWNEQTYSWFAARIISIRKIKIMKVLIRIFQSFQKQTSFGTGNLFHLSPQFVI